MKPEITGILEDGSLFTVAEQRQNQGHQICGGCQRNNHNYRVVETVPHVPVIFKGFHVIYKYMFLLSLLYIIGLCEDALYK